MLIEFSVANYRSFRDEVTFSMVASPLKAQDGELDGRNRFAAPGDISLLTSAAIYGANASGKSNLIAAFDFMQRFVRESHENTEGTGGIGVEPFRLSTKTESAPCFFEVVFIVGGDHYRYGFEVTEEMVVSEWLHVVPELKNGSGFQSESDEVILFERDGASITIHEPFEEEGRLLSEKTRPNALFLTVVAQFNGKTAQRVSDWFNSIEIASHWASVKLLMRLTTEQLLSDKDYLRAIESLIAHLDLGIEAIQIERADLPEVTLPDQYPAEVQTAIGAARDLFKNFEKTKIRTAHRKVGDDGQPVASEFFDLDKHESQGTEKLFSLAGPLVSAWKDGSILIVDELDASLHPLLTQKIVGLFNNSEVNSNNAQLIFATQDTNLLDHRLLRRDQIWFTEKDHQGASHLYSLVEFKIDNDALFERDYIQGRYGAIPFLGNIRQVFLEDE